MKPPYNISPEILALVAQVSEKIGEVNANFLSKPSPTLRKQNQIRTIHSSLKIEGNTLSQAQITALLDNKKVVGPQKDIQEVLNAIDVYEALNRFNPLTESSFLEAHKGLMQGLDSDAGNYRKQGVGIVKGTEVAHLAPPFERVPHLMKDLFEYLKSSDELSLIKSCVFHYELEFIHPFNDGNGRMGRLWQTLILKQRYPVFEFLSFETWISNDQEAYYRALALSDKLGHSTPFITYMLKVIRTSFEELLNFNGRPMSEEARITHFLSLGINDFSRKDYMDVFKNISSATASRDLKKAVEKNVIVKTGTMNKTRYNLP